MGSKKRRISHQDGRSASAATVSRILSGAGLHRREEALEAGFNVKQMDKQTLVFWHVGHTCAEFMTEKMNALIECHAILKSKGYRCRIGNQLLVVDLPGPVRTQSSSSPEPKPCDDGTILLMLEREFRRLRKAVHSNATGARPDWQCTVCGKGTHERHDPEKLCGKLEAIFRRSKTLMDPKRILR